MGKRERWGSERRKEADRIGALLAVFFVVAAGALVYLHQDAPRDGFLYKAEVKKNG